MPNISIRAALASRLSLPAAEASSPPADSVHFCVPFDYEQWRRDHSHPAAKRPAALNAGAPRTVRIIHFLSVHPYFNPDVPVEEGAPPNIELLSPTAYPADLESVSIRVEVGDTEGVHQVLLASQFAVVVKGCRGAADSKEAVLEFEYDGAHPLTTWMNLADPASHPIFFCSVDRDGKVYEQHYILTADSPYQIATLEGNTGITDAVAFSPDGASLVSWSSNGTVVVWDVAPPSGHHNPGHLVFRIRTRLLLLSSPCRRPVSTLSRTRGHDVTTFR